MEAILDRPGGCVAKGELTHNFIGTRNDTHNVSRVVVDVVCGGRSLTRTQDYTDSEKFSITNAENDAVGKAAKGLDVMCIDCPNKIVTPPRFAEPGTYGVVL